MRGGGWSAAWSAGHPAVGTVEPVNGHAPRARVLVGGPFHSSGLGTRRPPSPAPSACPAALTLSGFSAGLITTSGSSSLGIASGRRLFGIFEVDHVGHQPSAHQHVVQVVLPEGHPDREPARVNLGGPVQVSDDLGRRIKLGTRPTGQVCGAASKWFPPSARSAARVPPRPGAPARAVVRAPSPARRPAPAPRSTAHPAATSGRPWSRRSPARARGHPRRSQRLEGRPGRGWS